MQKTARSRSKHFVLHPLAEGIFAAIAENGGSAISNSGIIDLGGQIAIFDTFLTPQAAMDLKRVVDEMFIGTPRIVINSHYHNDHTWGNQVFAPEVQIVSTSRTRDLIASLGMEEYEYFSANSAQRLEALESQYQNSNDEQRRRELPLWLGYYQGLVEAMPYLTVCMPSITFESQLKIHGSKRTAELITFEGAHTQSDTILHLPGEEIVFMSDLLFAGCHPYLAEGDPDQLLKTLKEVNKLDAARFVPGHGHVGTIDDVALLIEYVEECLATAQKLFEAGTNEDKIAALKIPKKYRHWSLSEFFYDNIRFLYRRMNPAMGK
jgi:glyoxylase-like metal-dependent hydrolase (beta-lactamase superfamily II)